MRSHILRIPFQFGAVLPGGALVLSSQVMLVYCRWPSSPRHHAREDHNPLVLVKRSFPHHYCLCCVWRREIEEEESIHSLSERSGWLGYTKESERPWSPKSRHSSRYLCCCTITYVLCMHSAHEKQTPNEITGATH